MIGIEECLTQYRGEKKCYNPRQKQPPKIMETPTQYE